MISAAAMAWRGYAAKATAARETVDGQAAGLKGDAWKGATADTYHMHREKHGTDVDTTADAAAAVARALDDTAGWLNAAQSMLSQLFVEISLKVPTVVQDSKVTFSPTTQEQQKAIQPAINEAICARDHYSGEILRCTGELSVASAKFTPIINAWMSVVKGYTDPWTLPPEANTGVTVIYSGDDVVINTGTGDDTVSVAIDPKTGDQFVTINGQTLRYPAGAHLIVRTGEGNDEVSVPRGTNIDLTLIGGKGDDKFKTGIGNDIVLGNAGNDRVETGAGNDRASGGSGNDYLDGCKGNDIITGGTGDDIVYGLSGNDTLAGGEGNDYLEGGSGDDTLVGGDGCDTLSGGRDNDSILAGAGEDHINTGHGADNVDGGTGDDTVYGQREDSSKAVEHTVIVEIKDVGRHIAIEGSDEFKERVQADLDMLRASPRGQMMLEAWDQAHDRTKAIAADWPVLGNIAYQGDTFTIKETSEENGYANQNDRTLIKNWSQHPQIEYNPAFTHAAGPPVVVLYHEMSHVYDFENGGFDSTIYTGSDNPGVENGERAAVGLPIDHDNDPKTPNILDPNQPFEYTENGLREELGIQRRTAY